MSPQPPCLEEVEAGLVDKYQHIAPHFNFRRACAAVLATDLRVRLGLLHDCVNTAA